MDGREASARGPGRRAPARGMARLRRTAENPNRAAPPRPRSWRAAMRAAIGCVIRSDGVKARSRCLLPPMRPPWGTPCGGAPEMDEVFDFVDRRRGIGGLRAGGAAFGERAPQRRGDRSGRLGPAVLGADAARLRQDFLRSSLNWAYRAEADPGLAGRSDYWPRGKLLGGSSSINAMVWVRGDRRGFRRLGGRRQSRLELRRLPALFQSHRGQRGRRRRLAGPRRRAARHRRLATGCIRWPDGSSRRAGRRASRSIPISTAPRRKESASIRSTPRTAGACPPPRRSCARRQAARTSASSATRWSRASFSQGRRASGVEIRRGGAKPDRRRAARGDPRRGRGQFAATAANLGRRAGGASQRSRRRASCTTTPRSGVICKTISASITPTAAASKRSTRRFAPGMASSPRGSISSFARAGRSASASIRPAVSFARAPISSAPTSSSIFRRSARSAPSRARGRC